MFDDKIYNQKMNKTFKVFSKWQTKYFNSIQGWRIDQLDQGTNNDESIPAQKPFETTDLNNDQNDSDEEDDLPF